MPRQGYSDLIQRGYIDVYRRKSSDPFPEHLREELGEGEHPYPPWLQKEMDKVLPPDILERFEDTDGFWPCQDPYTHIDPEHKDEIIALLEQRGFTVEDGRDLDFY
jgi:hypothetical protein